MGADRGFHAESFAGDDGDLDPTIGARRDRNSIAGQILISGRRELVRGRQVDPDLETVRPAPVPAKGWRWQLRVHDAGARGHPLDISRADELALAGRVLVQLPPPSRM